MSTVPEQSKHMPTPVKQQSIHLQTAIANEAFDVYAETGKTPRALQSQNAELATVIEKRAAGCHACNGAGSIKRSWADCCAPGLFVADTPTWAEYEACSGVFACERCADLRAALTKARP